jgi:hypothetical protein
LSLPLLVKTKVEYLRLGKIPIQAGTNTSLGFLLAKISIYSPVEIDEAEIPNKLVDIAVAIKERLGQKLRLKNKQ